MNGRRANVFWTRLPVFLQVLVIAATAPLSFGQGVDASTQPDILAKVGIEQRLDEQIPLELIFKDETGETVALKNYFQDKPVVLALVYYECPMLCTMILNGLLKSLNALEFDIGDEFEVVTVSFDPKETPDLAAAKETTYVNKYGRPGAKDGWHFLTGEQSSIARLTDAAGFNYQYDPETGQYAHASAIMVLTPEGRLSRYLYGVEYSARDLRLSLIEASENKIGSPVDQVLLYCFHYDPTTGKYGLVIMNIIRVLGTATVLILGSFMFIMIRRDRKAAKTDSNTGKMIPIQDNH